MKIVKAVAQGKVLCVFFLFLFRFLLLLPGPVTSVEKNFYDVTPAAIRSGSDHSKVEARKKERREHGKWGKQKRLENKYYQPIVITLPCLFFFMWHLLQLRK